MPITAETTRNTLGVAAATERSGRTLVAHARLLVAVVAAVVLVVAHQSLADAVAIATFEGTFVASMFVAVLEFFVRPVQTVVDSVADPAPEDALAVVASVLILVTLAVLFVRTVYAIVVAVA